MLEIDHIFILTAAGAPLGDRLTAAGWTEGRSRRHPGQGTVNRCWFVRNAMLELLWVCDEAEARSPRTRPTQLWERWSTPGACRFGICWRGNDPLPFATWEYRPVYFPGRSIAIAENVSRLDEPFLFALPFATRPDVEATQPLVHALGWQELTRVTFSSPSSNYSEALRGAISAGLEVVESGELGLELGFDCEQSGRQLAFPEIGLRLCW